MLPARGAVRVLCGPNGDLPSSIEGAETDVLEVCRSALRAVLTGSASKISCSETLSPQSRRALCHVEVE